MEFSRQEYWSGLPFLSPRHLPDSEIEPRSPALQADSLLSEPPRKPHSMLYPLYIHMPFWKLKKKKSNKKWEDNGYSHAKTDAISQGQRRCESLKGNKKVHLTSRFSGKALSTRWQGQKRPRGLGVTRPAFWKLKCHSHLDSKALCVLLSWNLEEMKKNANQRVYYQIRRLHLTYILITLNVSNQS